MKSFKQHSKMDKIVGHDWEDIKRAQQGGSLHKKVDTTKSGDYGSDPIGDGTFRMVPSGDIVSFEERNRRLKK